MKIKQGKTKSTGILRGTFLLGIFSLLLLSILLVNCSPKEDQNSNGGSVTPAWVYSEVEYPKYLRMTKDGKYAIVAGDNKVALLDLIAKRRIVIYEVTPDELGFNCVSISETGYAIASTYENFKIFSATDSNNILTLSEINGRRLGGYPVISIPLTNDFFAYGFMRVSYSGNVVWYNPINLQDQNGNYYPNPNYDFANEMVCSGDGTLLALESSSYGKLSLFNGQNGTLLWRSVEEFDGRSELTMSNDGNIVVAKDLSKIMVFSTNPPALLFSRNLNYTPINSFKSVAASQNGNVIAVGDMSRLLIFKNLSQNPAVIKETNEGEILNIDMSADGSRIALSSYFGGLQVYDSNGNLVFSHDTPYSGAVSEVNISADGKTVTCIYEGKVHLYKLQ